MKVSRIRGMLIKEALELYRDPVTIAISLLFPLIMLFLFGYAISLDVENIRYGVWDLDSTPTSRALSDAFVQSRYFTQVGALDRSGVERALLSGRVRMALVIPEGFQAHLVRGETAPVQILVDGTDSNVAQIVVAYADAIVSSFKNTSIARVQPEMRVWYNPELRSANYVVPGLLGVIMMAFPPLLTALAVVREKESRSIEQIFASPLTSAEFVIGKLLPYGAVAFVEFLMVTTAGLLWFGVPFRGSFALLLGAAVIYVFSTVGIGLLVSTVTRGQVAALLLALVVTLMPSTLFSGFLFPVFTMPYALQLYSASFPARYFVELSRAVTLKGATLREVWVNIVILIAYTAAILVIAAWRIRKKVA